MSAKMRAKFVVTSVERFGTAGKITGEQVKFSAVSKSSAYPEDGSDEDNTYAKFSPAASCQIMIANPTLIGAFDPGDKVYVDFTPVEAS